MPAWKNGILIVCDECERCSGRHGCFGHEADDPNEPCKLCKKVAGECRCDEAREARKYRDVD